MKFQVKNLGKNLYKINKKVAIEFFGNSIIVYYNMQYSFELIGNSSQSFKDIVKNIIQLAYRFDKDVYNELEQLQVLEHYDTLSTVKIDELVSIKVTNYNVSVKTNDSSFVEDWLGEVELKAV